MNETTLEQQDLEQKLSFWQCRIFPVLSAPARPHSDSYAKFRILPQSSGYADFIFFGMRYLTVRRNLT